VYAAPDTPVLIARHERIATRQIGKCIATIDELVDEADGARRILLPNVLADAEEV
jgi:hypothetical protein